MQGVNYVTSIWIMLINIVEQEAENQIVGIQVAGFDVEPHRIIAETVFGSKPAMERQGFRRLVSGRCRTFAARRASIIPLRKG